MAGISFMQDVLPILRELGSLGLLAVVLVYIFRNWLPKRDQAFVEELREAREDFKNSLEQVWAKRDRDHSEQVEHHKREEEMLVKIEQHLSKVANGTNEPRA